MDSSVNSIQGHKKKCIEVSINIIFYKITDILPNLGEGKANPGIKIASILFLIKSW